MAQSKKKKKNKTRKASRDDILVNRDEGHDKLESSSLLDNGSGDILGSVWNEPAFPCHHISHCVS